MSYRHVPLCVHHRLQHFTGKAQFDAGNGVVMSMKGTLEHLDETQPAQVDVELPQLRSMPWWFHAYVYMCPGLQGDLHSQRPRVTMDVEASPLECYLPWLDCDGWAVSLPGMPVAVALETLCGYLPLHFVIRQGSTEYGRFVLQQKRRCTRIGH